MRTYTVHEPPHSGASVEDRAAGLVFTKEGFAVWALVAPALWLLFNRLWRELLIYLVLTFALVAAVKLGTGSDTAAGWASFLLNVIVGFEARDLKRRALERRGLKPAGIVTGRNLEEAERRFLTEWLPQARQEESAGTRQITHAGDDGPSRQPMPGMVPA